MALEQVAELEVFAEHVEALVPAEPLELAGMRCLLHAGGERAALEAVAAEFQPPETRPPRRGPARSRRRARGDALRRRAGAGEGGRPAAPRGTQMRRNTAPSVIRAASSQAASARTGQSSVRP